MNRRERTPRCSTVALALMALAPALQAQVIDDLELRREGANAVLTVRLATPIQFRRGVASATDDLLQVYYDVVPSRAQPNFIEGERRVMGGNGLPRITVTEDGGLNDLKDRKLVIRLDKPAKLRARAGRDNRSIDIQIDGIGASLALAGPQANTPTALPVVPGLSGIGSPSDAEIDARANQLLRTAQEALTRNEPALAIENLNEALNLPPNTRTRDAQELIAQARRANGDIAGARREAELYLQLYPDGVGHERVRSLLADLGDAQQPAPIPAAANDAARKKAATTSLTGALSQYYYGGNSKALTQLKDTPLDGQLPVVVSESTLSGTDQKQLLTAVDVNWRSRDTDRDQRFVFRDSFAYDGMPNRASKNKLSALYFDWKELGPGLSARVGRQSGLGGGVLGRFDGVQAGWSFMPKWKLNIVAGQPTDVLGDTHRWFAGTSVDAEKITANLGGSAYLIEQRIDGETDRRALGLDLRYFETNASVFSQLEYDLTLKGVNIASVQGTYTLADNTTFNVLLDRRATPMLMLGNALFFADPNMLVMPRKLDDLLAVKPIEVLRQQVVDTTAYATQALIGATTPLNPHWQVGADVRLTNIGAIAPVRDILPLGLPSTGNLWSVSGQVIGTNLYSERDTHVFNVTLLRGPTYSGWIASYNNLSVPLNKLQLEPSLRFYGQQGPSDISTFRWAPGLRLSWRGGEKWVLEAELSAENSKTTGPTQNEHATRLFYYLGYRLDF